MSLITKEHKLKYQDLWKYKDDQLTLSEMTYLFNWVS